MRLFRTSDKRAFSPLYVLVCGGDDVEVGNDLVVLLHRVKSEMCSEKNSPPKLSRLTTAAYHYRS